MFATDSGGFSTFITSVIVTANDQPIPAAVNCPPVVEPGVPFSCSFAAIGGDANLEMLTYAAWEEDDADVLVLDLTDTAAPPNLTRE